MDSPKLFNECFYKKTVSKITNKKYTIDYNSLWFVLFIIITFLFLYYRYNNKLINLKENKLDESKLDEDKLNENKKFIDI